MIQISDCNLVFVDTTLAFYVHVYPITVESGRKKGCQKGVSKKGYHKGVSYFSLLIDIVSKKGCQKAVSYFSLLIDIVSKRGVKKRCQIFLCL